MDEDLYCLLNTPPPPQLKTTCTDNEKECNFCTTAGIMAVGLFVKMINPFFKKKKRYIKRNILKVNVLLL